MKYVSTLKKSMYTKACAVALLATLLIVLGGCGSTKDPVVKTVYVNRLPPAELLVIAPRIPAPDLANATQADIAAWLLRYHERMSGLEQQIQTIIEFYSK